MAGGVVEHVLADALERLQKAAPEGVRLDSSDLQWHAFPQGWGSTALGFGGIGGQMITTAQTYVVLEPHQTHKACVYFAGQFAYMVEDVRDALWHAIRSRCLPSRRDRHKVEGNG